MPSPPPLLLLRFRQNKTSTDTTKLQQSLKRIAKKKLDYYLVLFSITWHNFKRTEFQTCFLESAHLKFVKMRHSEWISKTADDDGTTMGRVVYFCLSTSNDLWKALKAFSSLYLIETLKLVDLKGTSNKSTTPYKSPSSFAIRSYAPSALYPALATASYFPLPTDTKPHKGITKHNNKSFRCLRAS